MDLEVFGFEFLLGSKVFDEIATVAVDNGCNDLVGGQRVISSDAEFLDNQSDGLDVFFEDMLVFRFLSILVALMTCFLKIRFIFARDAVTLSCSAA